MANLEQLMRANLSEVFIERDAGRRRAAIARTYSPTVAFADPEGMVIGHDALDAKAQQVLDRAPGFGFRPDGPVLVRENLGCLAWQFGPAGELPVVRGMDIPPIGNELIARLYTLLLKNDADAAETEEAPPSGAPDWTSSSPNAELDRNIPARAHRIMAERAESKRTIEIPGASQVVSVSHPSETTQLILEAAGVHAARGAGEPAAARAPRRTTLIELEGPKSEIRRV